MAIAAPAITRDSRPKPGERNADRVVGECPEQVLPDLPLRRPAMAMASAISRGSLRISVMPAAWTATSAPLPMAMPTYLPGPAPGASVHPVSDHRDAVSFALQSGRSRRLFRPAAPRPAPRRSRGRQPPKPRSARLSPVTSTVAVPARCNRRSSGSGGRPHRVGHRDRAEQRPGEVRGRHEHDGTALRFQRAGVLVHVTRDAVLPHQRSIADGDMAPADARGQPKAGPGSWKSLSGGTPARRRGSRMARASGCRCRSAPRRARARRLVSSVICHQAQEAEGRPSP